MRLICWLLGCDTDVIRTGYDEDDFEERCRRCGTRGYARLFPLSLRQRLKMSRGIVWRIVHRCDPCRRLMFFTDEPSCSYKCYSDSMPF